MKEPCPILLLQLSPQLSSSSPPEVDLTLTKRQDPCLVSSAQQLTTNPSRCSAKLLQTGSEKLPLGFVLISGQAFGQ